jgi:hypothetical protein
LKGNYIWGYANKKVEYHQPNPFIHSSLSLLPVNITTYNLSMKVQLISNEDVMKAPIILISIWNKYKRGDFIFMGWESLAVTALRNFRF